MELNVSKHEKVYDLVHFSLLNTIHAHNGAILCMTLAMHDTYVLTGGGDAQVKVAFQFVDNEHKKS